MNLVTSNGAVAERAIGRRQRPRQACDLVVECKAAGGEWQRAILRDVSATGFRLVHRQLDIAGVVLWLRIAGLEPLPARMRWRKGRSVGCEFLAPLDPRTERRLRAIVSAAPRRPHPLWRNA